MSDPVILNANLSSPRDRYVREAVKRITNSAWIVGGRRLHLGGARRLHYRGTQ